MAVKPLLTYFLIFSGFFSFIFARWIRRRLPFQIKLGASLGFLLLGLAALVWIFRNLGANHPADPYLAVYVFGGSIFGVFGILLGLEIDRTRRGLGFLLFYTTGIALFFLSLPPELKGISVLVYGVQFGSTLFLAILSLLVPQNWLFRMGA